MRRAPIGINLGRLLADPSRPLPLAEAWRGFAAHSLATVLALFLITYLHVVFGELIPKMLALQSPDRTALLLAGPLNLFAQLSRPMILLMNGTGNAILRRFEAWLDHLANRRCRRSSEGNCPCRH